MASFEVQKKFLQFHESDTEVDVIAFSSISTIFHTSEVDNIFHLYT